MALLNIADAIYLGDRSVDRVYVGAQKVWPPGPASVYLGPQVGTTNGTLTVRRPIVTKITLPTDGEIVEIVAERSDSPQEFKIVLYADNSGVPDEMVYVSDALVGALTSHPVSIPATAGSYWLGVVSNTNNTQFTASVEEPGLEHILGDLNSWPSWTSPNPTEWLGGVNPPQVSNRVPYVGLWYVPAE